MNKADLADAGCGEDLVRLCDRLEAEGRTDECLRELRRHRAALVVALHEAQRPIDACDLIIKDLERKDAWAFGGRPCMP